MFYFRALSTAEVKRGHFLVFPQFYNSIYMQLDVS